MRFRGLLITCLLGPLPACGGMVELDTGNAGGGGVSISVGGNAGSDGSVSHGGVTVGGSSGSAGHTGGVDGGITACAPGAWVLVGQVSNARDLGGIALDNGAHVACGALFRGAAPVSSTWRVAPSAA